MKEKYTYNNRRPIIMEIKKHLLPIFFIIVFILGIYFILFKKNKEYYENQISNALQPSIEHFESNHDSFKKLANGFWSTPDTEVDGNSLKGKLIKITLNEENNKLVGDVQFKQIGEEEGLKIPITLTSNTFILAQDTNHKIEFDFKKDEQNPNPLSSEKIPMVKVTYQGYHLPIFNSFKIINPNIIGGKLSRIIASKQYLNTNIKEKYDMNTYQKYLNYKYPTNAFKIEYEGIPYQNNSSNSFYKKLKNEYNDTIFLCYQREYSTVDGEVVRTPLSQKYNLSVDNDRKLYFSKIILKNIQEENELNNIKTPFVLKNTYIYVYKMNKQIVNYISSPFPNKVSNSALNFKNNIFSFFGPYVMTNIFDSFKKQDKSVLNLTLLNKYVMTSNDMEITILPTDIEKII